MRDNTILQINVCQESPTCFRLHVDKWPDDVKEMLRMLLATQRAINEAVKVYMQELE